MRRGDPCAGSQTSLEGRKGVRARTIIYYATPGSLIYVTSTRRALASTRDTRIHDSFIPTYVIRVPVRPRPAASFCTRTGSRATDGDPWAAGAIATLGLLERWWTSEPSRLEVATLLETQTTEAPSVATPSTLSQRHQLVSFERGCAEGAGVVGGLSACVNNRREDDEPRGGVSC